MGGIKQTKEEIIKLGTEFRTKNREFIAKLSIKN
jgi:hypothetical protein